MSTQGKIRDLARGLVRGERRRGRGERGGWSLFRGAEGIFGAEKNGKSVCIVCTFVLDWVLSLKLILRGKEIL